MMLLVLLMLAALDFTDAQTGVCYGRLGSNLPAPSEVISLFNQNNITRTRLYDPYEPALKALSDFKIELMLGIPNSDLQSLGSSQDNANKWVQTYVKSYPNVKFRYIAVGNEVSPLIPDSSKFVPFVLPALRNIQTAISASGLGNNIKVSTSVETGLLTNTYPPSNGDFRSEVKNYLIPIIQFLVTNRAPLLMNIYPYFAYAGDTKVDLDFALFKSQGMVMPNGVRYKNLFASMLDGAYSALEKANASSMEIVVSETGWTSAGGKSTNVENVKAYNTNLIKYVKEGTPKRPGKPIETYIFAMFDEDQKNPEIEKHWGVFYPNKTHKYEISFN